MAADQRHIHEDQQSSTSSSSDSQYNQPTLILEEGDLEAASHTTAIVIDFDGKDDPSDPKNWSLRWVRQPAEVPCIRQLPEKLTCYHHYQTQMGNHYCRIPLHFHRKSRGQAFRSTSSALRAKVTDASLGGACFIYC